MKEPTPITEVDRGVGVADPSNKPSTAKEDGRGEGGGKSVSCNGVGGTARRRSSSAQKAPGIWGASRGRSGNVQRLEWRTVVRAFPWIDQWEKLYDAVEEPGMDPAFGGYVWHSFDTSDQDMLR